MIITALLVMIIAVHGGTALAASETLYVPYTDGPFGPLTGNVYSGAVTIDVTGYGQAAGSQYSDAFYIFTNSDGIIRVPEAGFGLLINEQPASHYLGSTPSYRADHHYRFTINVKNSRLRFQFGVDDLYTGDNAGGLTVTVSSGGIPNTPPQAGIGLLVPYPSNEDWARTAGSTYPNGEPHYAWEWPEPGLGVAHDYAPTGVKCKDGDTVLTLIDYNHHVVSMGAGTVIRVDVDGAWLAIDHGRGRIGFYLHVGNIQVREGQRVSPSTDLGSPSVLGGYATGCHVHVAIATYVTPPKVGQWNPNHANWSADFPDLVTR